jgi:GGDEF domain-containing protein
MAMFNLLNLSDRLFGEVSGEPRRERLEKDPLTRLPTRDAIVHELEKCLAKSRHKGPVGLAIVDFSNVQGLIEHGDAVDPDLLARLTSLMQSRVEGHVVGHLRDREFAVILCGVPIAEVEHLADELIAAVRSDKSLAPERRYIATFVGVGYSSRADVKATQLMSLADIALHYALATGRGCHVIVDRVPPGRNAA